MGFIEMIGLPGSGKTTYYTILQQELNSQNILCYDENKIKEMYLYKKYKVLNVFSNNSWIFQKVLKSKMVKNKIIHKFKKEHPLFNAKVSSIISNMQISNHEQKKIFYLLYEVIYVYELANIVLKNNEYLFMDEGYFHKLSTLFVAVNRYIDKYTLEELLFFYGKPRKLIYLNLNEKMCFINMTNRPKGIPKRIKSYSIEKQKQHVNNIKFLQEYIIELSNTSGIDIIFYDTSKAIKICE